MDPLQALIFFLLLSMLSRYVLIPHPPSVKCLLSPCEVRPQDAQQCVGCVAIRMEGLTRRQLQSDVRQTRGCVGRII